LKWLVAALWIIAVALAGCRRQAAGPDGQGGEVVLYCGAGIRPAVAEVIEAFEAEHDIRVVTDYAGSEVLLSKIRLVQSGDLYLPGDRHYIEQARQAGMIAASWPVFYWVPAILVAKGNPKGMHDLSDLMRPGIRVGLGDPRACAIGRTTKDLFEKNGIGWADIEQNLKFQSQTVNELGMQIQAGSLDAVIVWDAIARYYVDYGDLVAIPAEKNVISSVDIGILTCSRRQAAAEAFVVFLLSPEGMAIFHKHHYSTAPGR
jgi:molybdate transport system substrate-binding protein